MDSVIPYLFSNREVVRVNESYERQYKLLKWLSWQFTNNTFLDAGTRCGTSALCLADNPSNKVLSCDITHIFKGKDIRPTLSGRGVKFIEKDALNLDANLIRSCNIISLDISHNGYDELNFLDMLNTIQYNGIVIMDDINTPSRFPRLHSVWKDIIKPKVLLPPEIAHDTGTGVVAYGDHTFKVV